MGKDLTTVHQPLHQRGQEPPAHIYAQLRARIAALPIPMVKSLPSHVQRRTTRSKRSRAASAEVRGSIPLGSTRARARRQRLPPKHGLLVCPLSDKVVS